MFSGLDFGKALMEIKKDLSVFSQDLYNSFFQHEEHSEICLQYNKIFSELNNVNKDLGDLIRRAGEFDYDVTLNETPKNIKREEIQQAIQKLIGPQEYCPDVSITGKKIRIAPEKNERLKKCINQLWRKGYAWRKIAACLNLTQNLVKKMLKLSQSQKQNSQSAQFQHLNILSGDSVQQQFEKKVCQFFIDKFTCPKKRVPLKKLTAIARKIGKSCGIKKVTQKKVKQIMKAYDIEKQLIVIMFDFQEKSQ